MQSFIAKWSILKDDFSLDTKSIDRLLKVFNNTCVISGNVEDLNSTLFNKKMTLCPRIIDQEVRSLKDLVVISSSIASRISKQKGLRLPNKKKCVIHIFDSAEVRERIRSAHEQLDRIEAAEKKLREVEECIIKT